MRNRPALLGGWLLVLGAAAGLALSIYIYSRSIAIGGTIGALIVVCTTSALLVISLLLLVTPDWPRWLRWLRVILWTGVLVDICGTGFAAWMLELYLLIAFLAVALVGWLGHVLSGNSPPPHSANA